MKISLLSLLFLGAIALAIADDPYRFYTWRVTYGTIYPLGGESQLVRSLFISFSIFQVLHLHGLSLTLSC